MFFAAKWHKVKMRAAGGRWRGKVGGIPTGRLAGLVGDLLNENDLVRHDPHKLARLLLELYSSEVAAPHRLAGVQ